MATLSDGKTAVANRRFSYRACEEGNLYIPNNPLIAAFFSAVFKGGPQAKKLLGGWNFNEAGELEFRHIGRKRGQISVKVDKSAAGNAAAQWEVVEALSPLTVDTGMAILAELSHPGNGKRTKFPLMQPIPITVDHVLRYKKFHRYGEERKEFRERVAAEFRILQKLRIDIVDYPGWDISKKRWNANGISLYGDKPFDLVEGDLEGETGSDAVWMTRYGSWASIWMNAQSKVWVVQVPRSVMELDHRQSRAAQYVGKKLGLHALMLGATAHARPVLVRRVDRLLEDLGELPDVAYRTSHWSGRIRDRLEEAVLNLTERQVFPGISWSPEFGPASSDRFKGWTNPWLASKLQLTLPQAQDANAQDAQA